MVMPIQVRMAPTAPSPTVMLHVLMHSLYVVFAVSWHGTR